MAPAFASTRQAGAFAILVAVLLGLPLVLGRGILSSREAIYSSYSWGSGAYPYLQDQIYHHREPIDILFTGSSHMNSGIDPAYVQRKLSEHLGRPATVLSLCWGGAGFDIPYLVTRDLLERRQVRMIVFYDDHGPDAPSGQSWRMIRWHDAAGAMAGLPWRLRLAYYYGAILSLPRALFNAVVPTQSTDLSPAKKAYVHDAEFHPPDQWLALTPPAADAARLAELPPVPARPEEVLTYGAQTADRFDLKGPEPAPLQIYFARRFLDVAKKNGADLVCLNIPVLDDWRDTTVPEGPLWQELFQRDSVLVGVPPSQFFQGMSKAQVRDLYRNPAHLNALGQKLFTETVTPRLIELYDQTKP